MISDQITLGSSSAYLRNDSGSVNLGGTSPSTARTKKLKSNQIWDISGLELLIEGDDLTPLLHLPDTPPGNQLNNPLMEIKIQKEVFPSLFTNPFETRVHNVAGFDDFERGKSTNCFVTEVNDIPTLVSKGAENCEWESVVYKLPTEINIYAASWELATSRLVNEDQFEYDIKLLVWQSHSTDGQAGIIIDLAENTDADDARTYYVETDENVRSIKAKAFQLKFSAVVKVDSAFYESHRMDFNTSQEASTMAGDTIGTPLLRSIRLLERVESNYRFYSLNELIQAASFYQMFDPQGGDFHRLLLNLDFSAVLVGREETHDSGANDFEYLELSVLSPDFKRIQAKLLVEERLRIPRQ